MSGNLNSEALRPSPLAATLLWGIYSRNSDLCTLVSISNRNFPRSYFSSQELLWDRLMRCQTARSLEFLGDQKVLARISYIYDDQSRVSEKRDDIGPSDHTITKITYNDHGDEAEEIGTTSHPLIPRKKPKRTSVISTTALATGSRRQLAPRRRRMNPAQFGASLAGRLRTTDCSEC